MSEIQEGPTSQEIYTAVETGKLIDDKIENLETEFVAITTKITKLIHFLIDCKPKMAQMNISKWAKDLENGNHKEYPSDYARRYTQYLFEMYIGLAENDPKEIFDSYNKFIQKLSAFSKAENLNQSQDERIKTFWVKDERIKTLWVKVKEASTLPVGHKTWCSWIIESIDYLPIAGSLLSVT